MWYNPLVTWLLRSPLRRLADGGTLLFTYTGRKSGRAYTFPISYALTANGVRLLTAPQKTWWKNLGESAPVTLWLRGAARTGRASVTPMTYAARVTAMLEVYRGIPRRLAEQQAESMIVVDVQVDPTNGGAVG